jgi:hypothetical protein
MRTTKRFTPKVIARFERQHRGEGTYADYIPWHRVSRGDPASSGRSHLLMWRDRLRELLSDGELVEQLFATMLPDLDDSLARVQSKNGDIETSEFLVMMTAAADCGDMDSVEQCAKALYSDHNGNDSMTQRINEALDAVGLTELATTIRNRTNAEMRSLNLAAVNLAKHGKVKEAIEEFMHLAESRHSVSIYLNAATALILLFEQESKRQSLTSAERKLYGGRLDRCIAYVRKHDPGNTKVGKIADEWKRLRS